MAFGKLDTDLAPFTRAIEAGDQYVTRVAKSTTGLDVERVTAWLNAVWRAGFRLHVAYELSGSTIYVFERRNAS